MTKTQREVIIGATIFLAGTFFGQWITSSGKHVDLYEVQDQNETVITKLNDLLLVCTTPAPDAKVTITSKDIIDAARGKSLEFTVGN